MSTHVYTDPRLRADSGATDGVPVWLNLGGQSVYAVLHQPEPPHRNVAVIMMPTFGWDEACAYRSRREWAISLAHAGFPVVRFDLPGSEDSVGSPLDASRFESWLRICRDLGNWLRQASSAERILGIGVGLGGLLLVESIRTGAEIDDLVLWAVPGHGRSYVRELRLYTNAMSGGEEEVTPDGVVSMGGHILSTETVEAVNKLKLSEPMSLASVGHVLMLERDAYGVDTALRQALADGGAEVTVMASDEYAGMMTSPDVSRVPSNAIRASVDWICDRSAQSQSAYQLVDSDGVSGETAFAHDGQMIRESHVRFDTDSGPLVGLLAEPVTGVRFDLGLITHNAGALRRTGPNRMWTGMCRRWAARGVPTLRFDLEGIGDSAGRFVSQAERRPEQDERIIDSRIAVADALQRDQIAGSFVGVGLCLGAYWEMKSAIRDQRVRGIVQINQLIFDATPEHRRERSRRSALAPVRDAFRPRPAGAAVSRPSVAAAAHGLGLTLKRSASAAQRSQLEPALLQFDALADSETRVMMLFGKSEVLYGQMRRLGLLDLLPRWPLLQVVELPTKDHELRPLQIQELVRERVDRFIGEVLEANDGSAARTSSDSV